MGNYFTSTQRIYPTPANEWRMVYTTHLKKVPLTPAQRQQHHLHRLLLDIERVIAQYYRDPHISFDGEILIPLQTRDWLTPEDFAQINPMVIQLYTNQGWDITFTHDLLPYLRSQHGTSNYVSGYILKAKLV